MTSPEQSIAALKNELKQLHEQMDDALDVDKKTFVDDVINQLHKSEKGTQNIDETTLNKLETEAAELVSDHPRLSAILREIADQLGKLGI